MPSNLPRTLFVLPCAILVAASCLISQGPTGSNPRRTPTQGRPSAGTGTTTSNLTNSLPVPCTTTVRADVVALDQVLVWNKFGSRDPYGMIFALERDVVPQSGSSGGSSSFAGTESSGKELVPGQVQLRSDLRPRPLVLRVNRGECLEVRFTNLLDPEQWSNDTPATRTASFHVNGMPHADLASYGANVGANPTGLVGPGESRTYTFVADREGTFSAMSFGAIAGGEGDGGSLAHGLFGAVIVEPEGSTWLHSSTGLPIRVDNTIVSGTDHAIIHGFHDPHDRAEVTPEGAFREFAWIFHDQVKTVHANPRLDTEFWLHSLRDGFGVNYGVTGMGQILLDALCHPDCRLEEAFLTSWANGDPALLPHFPDDPSNVWHSYLGDHVRMRVLHAGPAETHVFHLHAHQWLYSDRDDSSSYLDSQTVGPGSAFTCEVSYAGGGNRNLSPGDSIFHCHLYPHFAQGMWGLWRNHDVFEDGSRTLPDGTPIPRVAPIPGRALPPLPSAEVPGYPFFVPGRSGQWPVAGYPGNFKPGHRPPQPPLDMAHDGGLPRHIIVNGPTQGSLTAQSFVPHTLTEHVVVPENGMLPAGGYDYAILPQGGTRLERNAMAFHASRSGGSPHSMWGSVPSKRWDVPASNPSPTDYLDPRRASAAFRVNGLPPAPGAPFANPCPPGAPIRNYHVASIDVSIPVNNDGWHDPQGRINILAEDVEPTLAGQRPVEPLFIRANSGDCLVVRHTNHTARELHEDHFQIQTPTDTIGLHIHLVKFDVMASDGGGNGWNYEDGTFSPQEIDDRLLAMGFPDGHPASTSRNGGLQVTTQRWWADPLLNGRGEDRTIRTVFMHDHFSPSSIQQHGCYSALVIEPPDSTWWDPVTGEQFGTRADGGPTSWRADIHTGVNGRDSFREFCLAVADFAPLYDEGHNPVNPPRNEETGEIEPEAISSVDPGTMTVNYRNEPIPLRIGEPREDGSTRIRSLRSGMEGRLPHVFSSALHGDPVTPILELYQGDRFQIRLIQGAQEDSHAFKINRLKWYREAGIRNSGFVNGQHIGISEHFEFEGTAIAQAPFPVVRNGVTLHQPDTNVDLLWSDASEDGLWNGAWGLMRVFGSEASIDPATGMQVALQPLPNNGHGIHARNGQDFNWPCPKTAPVRQYSVSAVTAASALGPNGIVYNQAHQVFDPTGLMYVRNEDLDASGRLKPTVPREPLILRANAGDCLRITLTNRLPANRSEVPDLPDSDAHMTNLTRLNVNDIRTDNLVGMTIDLVYTDGVQEGSHVGHNPNSLVAPGETRTFTWYCGDLLHDPENQRVDAVPETYGVCSIRSWGDAIKQGAQGLIGALVVEPEGSTWTHPDTGLPAPTGSRAVIQQSSVGDLPPRFHEFVLLQQAGLNLHQERAGNAIPSAADDPEDSGQKAFNYRTEPFWARLEGEFVEPDEMNDLDFTNVFRGATETPVFEVPAGEQVMFRLTTPVGRARAGTFTIHGHRWRDMYCNTNTAVMGQQTGNTVGSNWNLLLLDGAGGPQRVRGDFLFHELSSFQLSQGLWGILRVR
ncbi:MAG: hypothetical protein RIT25_302 [Planctomycetota bacterium]